MKENSAVERLFNGIVKENPTFVLLLGMCPTLAVTTSAINGLGMGLTTMVILTMSNMMISLLRKLIPDSVRMPGLHRHCCQLRNDRTVPAGRFYSGTVFGSWNIYSAYCCKLYYSRPCGSLCVQK